MSNKKLLLGAILVAVLATGCQQDTADSAPTPAQMEASQARVQNSSAVKEAESNGMARGAQQNAQAMQKRDANQNKK